MTTKELVSWAMQAQTVRENSWQDDEGEYRLTIREAVNQIRPNDATDAEQDIASCLNYEFWNEVQDWFVLL